MEIRQGSMEGMGMKPNLEFFRNKRVFVTGHTGFKGSWLCRILVKAGAAVTGYSLPVPKGPNLFELAGLDGNMNSIMGDIRDFNSLKLAFEAAQPEFVFHLAAQPLVRDSYHKPRMTYETNVMGTVNLLECVRLCHSVKSFLNITTDKVYQNKERIWSYREYEYLDGFDPYSNSKSCSDLITHSYKNSFFGNRSIAINIARTGNVIGGGDFAVDRIIPDCIRAIQDRKTIIVRNPQSIRPYQHVLESVFAYLIMTEATYKDRSISGWYNIGPDENDCITTGELVDLFCKLWGYNVSWEKENKDNALHEANFLKLDSTKFRYTFNWMPRWHIKDALENTCEWYHAWICNDNCANIMDNQIMEYLND